MEYKPTFTKEEIDELISWFTTHKFEKELILDKGIVVKDLDKALPPLIHVAQTRYENRNFSGQIFMLYKIREALIKQGKVIGEI